MALTDHCDVYGSLHERGLNRIFRHLMLQRPSLFNYGTSIFVSNPRLLCQPVNSHPEVLRRGNPLITEEDPLAISGTDGILGIHFCMQLAEFELDIHKSNRFELPAQLGGKLTPQQLALRVKFCVGLACPPRDTQEQFGDYVSELLPPLLSVGDKRQPTKGEKRLSAPPFPIPAREVQCFCLEVFATASVDSAGSDLAIRLRGLEIVDIKPDGLESIIECYVSTVLRVAVLPRIRFALDTMIFALGEYATLSISPTPISADVPHNPALEQDELRVFIDAGVS